MRIMLTVYKGYDKVPFDKVRLNAEDESDIHLILQDIESWLTTTMYEMEESDA